MRTKKCIKRIAIISFSLLILLYLGGCAKTKQEMLATGMKPMTIEEFQSFLAEKRVAKYHVIKKDQRSTVTYLPDGSVNVVTKGGKVFTGTYSLVKSDENDVFCSKMSHRNYKEVCSSWIKIDDNTYNVYGTDGSLIGDLTFQ